MSQQFLSDVSATTKDCMYQYMAALLPGKTVSDIAGHNEWYVSCELLVEKVLPDVPYITRSHAPLTTRVACQSTKQLSLYHYCCAGLTTNSCWAVLHTVWC